MKRTALLLTILICASFSLHAAEMVHVVRKGETLYSLSREYGISVNDIIRVNGIEDPSSLAVGMEIKIPTMYVVEKGDTLYSLAKKFGITLDELCGLNDIEASKVLIIGQKLLVPGMPGEEATVERIEVPREDDDPEAEPAPNPSLSVDMEAKPYFWPHAGQASRLTGKLQGLQFEGKDGDTIRSVSNGKVVWVGPYRGYNKIVFVQTMDDYIYGYGGNNDILVKVGDRVEPGTEIGHLGVNPHEGKARMFFFVYRDGVAVDPYAAPRE